MTIQELLAGGGGLVLLLLTLVQIAPVKINPWSALAKTVGKAVNNELLRPIDHTKEEFVEVLAKIDDYERYCEEHPEYPNNRAVLAIENIREVYKERLKKRDFLQESHAKDEEEGDVC